MCTRDDVHSSVPRLPFDTNLVQLRPELLTKVQNQSIIQVVASGLNPCLDLRKHDPDVINPRTGEVTGKSDLPQRSQTLEGLQDTGQGQRSSQLRVGMLYKCESGQACVLEKLL